MPRDRAFLDWLRIDRTGAVPLQQQIFDQLLAAIGDGRLVPGTPLPSSRALAADLTISRGTVIAVYDRLIGDGLLQVLDRSAISVAEVVGRPRDGAAGSGRVTRAEGERSPAAQAEYLWRQHAAFLTGVPAFDVFPAARWARLVSARARQVSVHMVGEGMHRGGYAPLQAALAAHLRTARGVVCDPDQVIIAGSARAAVAMLCRLLARPGDRCLVEDPGYMVSRRIIAACGLQPVPIAVDAHGIGIEAPVPAARLAYLTPTHQMPLGVTLADYRGRLLLEWSAREDAWIIEDDYDSEFRYAGQPVVALQHADPDRVVYIGTFSKTMFPGLRIACVIVPARLVKAASDAVYLDGQAPNVQVQAALADFVAQGHYAAHIRKARAVYRRRQGLLVAAINRHLASITSIAQPAGGMTIIVPLPDEIPAAIVHQVAASSALHARAVTYYTEGGQVPNALHLGFAAIPERLIEASVLRLAEVIAAVRAGATTPAGTTAAGYQGQRA